MGSSNCRAMGGSNCDAKNTVHISSHDGLITDRRRRLRQRVEVARQPSPCGRTVHVALANRAVGPTRTRLAHLVASPLCLQRIGIAPRVSKPCGVGSRTRRTIGCRFSKCRVSKWPVPHVSRQQRGTSTLRALACHVAGPMLHTLVHVSHRNRLASTAPGHLRVSKSHRGVRTSLVSVLRRPCACKG